MASALKPSGEAERFYRELAGRPVRIGAEATGTSLVPALVTNRS